ncbi:MAG: hypothetical protein HOL37_01810 [Rhodospirillaceae bacterium]|nr:hypothetical protein [Rhodospirillaceae bacterium]MBT5014209.1 hypothetical protein [Rhodospirillaceae bacterium]MBT5308046.1 hypothetical protein [Rhodospirillaceae bacterium]MBT7357025.1 hypothetical protein [Rhodospirillaceae bacterium]
MTECIVYQSFRTTDVPPWMETCMASVRDWAALKGIEYRFVGDELVDMVPGWYQDKAAGRMPVITDLGRLLMARELLTDGYSRTIWVDADVLIFDPQGFNININININDGYAFGREIWVQPGGKKGGLRVYHNVHNAVCVFDQYNSFLDFYIDACQRVLRRYEGEAMVNQIVGPKLLNALNTMVGLPLIDDAGMLCPLVMGDIDRGGGAALDMLKSEMTGPMRAANLCASLSGGSIDGIDLDDDMVGRVCDKLLEMKGL